MITTALPPAGSADEKLLVLHVDDTLLVLDKPAGLLCVPGRGALAFDALSLRAQAHFSDALIVHRLDMVTSGLVLMARGKATQRLLSAAFERRRVEKHYLAVVDGLLEADAGTITMPLSADWEHRPLQAVDWARGKPSVTHYRVLARDVQRLTTHVELQPVTGRSHQLRVHLKAIGHPILGDTLYAPEGQSSPHARLMLHAHRLRLAHPSSGEDIGFESRAPF